MTSKKKTLYSWIVLILTAILTYQSIIYLITISTGLYNKSNFLIPLLQSFWKFSSPLILIFHYCLAIIISIVGSIFFFKLYNVKPDLIKWAHVAFGFYIFSTVEYLLKVLPLMLVLPFGTGILIEIIEPSIIIIIWVTFAKHLKRAQRENLMDFS